MPLSTALTAPALGARHDPPGALCTASVFPCSSCHGAPRQLAGRGKEIRFRPVCDGVLQCEAKHGALGGADSPAIGAPAGGDGALDPTYLQLFLLKYLCGNVRSDGDGCFGTMVPPAAGVPACACNRCAMVVTDVEFEMSLEADGT